MQTYESDYHFLLKIYQDCAVKLSKRKGCDRVGNDMKDIAAAGEKKSDLKQRGKVLHKLALMATMVLGPEEAWLMQQSNPQKDKQAIYFIAALALKAFVGSK